MKSLIQIWITKTKMKIIKRKKSKSKASKKKTNNNEKFFTNYPLSCKVTFSVRGKKKIYISNIFEASVKIKFFLIQDMVSLFWNFSI